MYQRFGVSLRKIVDLSQQGPQLDDMARNVSFPEFGNGFGRVFRRGDEQEMRQVPEFIDKRSPVLNQTGSLSGFFGCGFQAVFSENRQEQGS